MAQVEKIIPSLTGGVSQQPPSLRFPGQVEVAENCRLSLVDGAAKRPPTNHVAELIASLPEHNTYQLIERDGTDYVAIFSNQGPSGELPSVRVFDLEGTEYLVTDNNLAGTEFVPAHYIADSPDNYLGDWEQPGYLGAWTTAAPDNGGAVLSAEVGPLGYGLAVSLSDESAGAGDGLFTRQVSAYMGEGAVILSVYAKKDEGMDSFRLDIRDDTNSTTYSASFAWSGSALVTSGSPTIGSSYVEQVGATAWYRAILVVPYEDEPESESGKPKVGDFIKFVRIALVQAGATTPADYFWGMQLNFDDVEVPDTAPPVKNDFGPFRFLTIADATFVLNTQFTPRLAGPVAQTRREWMDTLPDEVSQVLRVTFSQFYPSSDYNWELVTDATYSGTISSDSAYNWGVLDDILTDIKAADGQFAASTNLYDPPTVQDKVLEIRSTYPITSFTFTSVLMQTDLLTISDTLLVSVQEGLGSSTDYDWSVTNSAGTHSGTYTSATTDKTTIAAGIVAQIVAADASLDQSTSNREMITIKSTSEITASSFEPDLLLGFDPYVEDVMYVFVQQGSDTFDYTWSITNGSGTFTDTFTATDSETTSIASSILTQIQDADASLQQSIVSGSIIEVRSLSKITKFSVNDDAGDTQIVAFRDEIETITDLPLYFRDGYRVKISPDPTTDLEDYYVKFTRTDEEEGDGFGPGVWTESTDWGTILEFDRNSMPHQLVLAEDDSDGTVTGTAYQTYFTFGPSDWTDREAGEAVTNPSPSFIGKKINDLFFDSNRFGFVAGGNLIASEAGVYFNFWRTTTTSVPDSDPIDIASNETKLGILQSAQILGEQLVVSSPHAQFILGGNPPTPATAVLNRVSSFRVSSLRPFSTGRSLAYTTFGVDYSGTLELYRDEENLFRDEETSQIVPKYIAGPVTFGAELSREGYLFLYSDDLYVYKSGWSGERRIQSAWSKWTFGPNATLEFLDFSDGVGVFLFKRDGALFLETLNLEDGLVDAGQNLVVHLDRRISNRDVTSEVYSAIDDKTTITLPFDLDTGLTAADVAVAGLNGVEIPVAEIGTDTVVVYGDVTSEDYWVGERYSQSITLSEPVPQRDGPTGPIRRQGRYQVSTVDLELAETGAFKAEVVYGGQTFTHEYNSQTIGGLGVNAGEIDLYTGNQKFGVMAPASGTQVTLSNSTVLPSRFIGLVWNGDLSAFNL